MGAYAVTMDDTFWLIAGALLPLVFIRYATSVFMKPRRKYRKYLAFLGLHFFQFGIFSEVLYSIGNYRSGVTVFVFTSLFRVVCLYLPTFYTIMKIRHSAVNLEDNDLSTFLTQRLLKGCATSIFPLLFVSFETVTCFTAAPSESRKKEDCRNANIYSICIR
jgi:hypothetical protein